MNISQLRAFVAVVDHGSFSEAARVLGLSQPAVTMQIQGLESDIGATLLDRRYRKIDLTEAGRELVPRARKVLEEIEQARQDIANLSDSVTGRLTIAASTTPGQYILPRLLGGFLRDYPEVGISLIVHDTAEVVEAVETGRAQLGMVGARVRGARATFEPLGTDHLIVICPPDSVLADAEGLLVGDLTEEPFIMREPGSGTRQVAEATLLAEGVDPDELRVVTELGTSEAIVRAVEGGLGIGIVSRWVAEKALQVGTVREAPVGGFPVERPFYLVTPRGSRTRAAEAFANHLRESLG